MEKLSVLQKRVGLFDDDFFWSPAYVSGYDLEWDMDVVTYWVELPELPNES